MTVEKRTWAEVLEALEHDYTLSIRDVCRLLKASRPWVNRYIKPHVDTIFLNSNRRAGHQAGPNWVKMAGMIIGKDDITESTWYHKDQLYKLLSRSIVSITKQIKSVPLLSLMPEDLRPKYLAEKEDLNDRLDRTENAREEKELIEQLMNLPGKYLEDDAMELISHHVGITQRGQAERLEVAYPGEFAPELWVAAHDIKDYGDTDEDVYRHFFRNGYIRIELNVPDANGEVGAKVFYIPDPDPIDVGREDAVLNIPEAIWQAYKTKKGI